MNQTLEERIASFRSMIVDYNTGTIKNKDVIKKEMTAINALNNSEFKLYFYTYFNHYWYWISFIIIF